MESNTKRCFRCSGRKKMYKMGNIYSVVDTGGIEVTCPLCNGAGTVDIPKMEMEKEKENFTDVEIDQQKDLMHESEQTKDPEQEPTQNVSFKKQKRKAN